MSQSSGGADIQAPVQDPEILPPRAEDGSASVAPSAGETIWALSGRETKRETRALAAGRNRIVLAAAGFMLLFGVLAVRLVGLALTGPDDLTFLRAAREPDHPRADIVDRNGMLLATDVTVWAAYADPSKVWDPEDTADQLAAKLPDVNRDRLAKRLSGTGRFVWIARELTPQDQFEIHNLGLPGIGFIEERKRFYPHGEAVAHVLGYVDVDGSGIAGAEKAFDQAIAGRTHADEPVALSIDLRVQHSLNNELANAMERFRAKGAAGVILDVETGEVLAMSSLPGFSPNALDAAGADNRFNRVTAGVYELGSTVKAFTVAAALDSHTVTLEDGYDATDPIQYGRFRIRDFHAKKRYLTVPEIFHYSSNIGSAKMAMDIGTETFKSYFARFGLLERPSFELRETAAPLLPARWGEIETMTVSYGHGLAISPLQLAVGAAALVNGGCLPRATVLKTAQTVPGPCDRVISEETSRTMRMLMRDVVERGTGKQADVEGYPVAGKTGSAEKAKRGGYDRRALISSFMGVFPAQDPRYLVLVLLDEPRGTKETHYFATGGWTAAPVVAQIVKRMAPMVGVTPQFPPAEETLTPEPYADQRGLDDLSKPLVAAHYRQ